MIACVGKGGKRRSRLLARVHSRTQFHWTPFTGCSSPDKSNTRMLVRQITTPGCYIGKFISSCSSRFILSKILSSLGSSWSMIKMMRSTVKLYQPRTHNCLTQAFSSYFSNLFLCHTAVCKIRGVACWLGSSQSLDSQSELHRVIRNCLTTHSKPGLWYC